MRKRVKVVISGDGGDELFGGYSRFNHVATIDHFRITPFKRLVAAIVRFSAPILGVDTARRIIMGLEFAAADRNEIFTLLNTYFTEPDRKSILAPEFAEAARAIPPTWTRVNAFIPESAKNQKERMMGLELGLMLHGDYLRKVDIASSAHGLEVRVPFLDTEVLDFAASVPTRLKLKGKTTKFLLRELARKKISDRIADKRKWGFGIPFDKWCQGGMMDYLRDLLLSERAATGLHMVFKKSEVEKIWKLFVDEREAENAKLQISRYQIYQRVFIMASIQIWFDKWKPVW
jgi:asparagine synthase (glutamine-hydrolysing)